jgi:cellulose synthase/poly-beta-1,6-N-acetylglucosamine synthase-like glycosyltransferase
MIIYQLLTLTLWASSIAMLIYLINYLYLAGVALFKNYTPSKATVTEWPPVSIHIPIYNERYVAERLIEAVIRLDYPPDKLQVIIIDDSNDDTSDIIARTLQRHNSSPVEILHVKREGRIGFKAGALQEALKRTKGEYVAIFDADFLPAPDFLKNVLPYLLSDERIGCVQVRWEHLNRDHSFLTLGQAINLDLHFEVEQRARSSAGLFLNFNGTAGVWRRKCLEDIEGWRAYLAEDLEASIRAQLKGWKLIYIPDVSCPGEIPPQMEAVKRQQHRWAYGAIEVAKDYLAPILKSGIPARVKVQAFFHFTRHIPQLMSLMVLSVIPLAILLSIYSPPRNAVLSLTWTLFTAGILVSTAGFSSIRYLPSLIVFTTSMIVNNSIAVIEALIGRKRGFARTPKFGEGDWRNKRYVLPLDTQSYFELSFGVLLVATALFAILRGLIGYMPFLLIAGCSLIYAGWLSIRHAPKDKRQPAKRPQALKLLIIAVVALTLVGIVYGYSQTYYRLDVASAYVFRGASTGDAREIVSYIEESLKILPESGNPVWLFPTPRTDFALIRRDLNTLRELAIRLSGMDAGTPEYQQGIDQIKDSLRTIYEQILEAAPFYFISPISLLLTILWLAAFIYLIRLYGRARRGVEG